MKLIALTSIDKTEIGALKYAILSTGKKANFTGWSAAVGDNKTFTPEAAQHEIDNRMKDIALFASKADFYISAVDGLAKQVGGEKSYLLQTVVGLRHASTGNTTFATSDTITVPTHLAEEAFTDKDASLGWLLWRENQDKPREINQHDPQFELSGAPRSFFVIQAMQRSLAKAALAL